MTPERLKQIRQDFNQAQDRLDEIIGNAMVELFKEIVGRDPRDKTYEAIMDAIRQEQYR